MADHVDTVRSPEQVATDLAKAMLCTEAEVRSLRSGVLPAGACQRLLGKVIQPLVRAALIVVIPLLAASFISSSTRHTSLADGLLTVLAMPGNIKEYAENDGWFHTILYSAIGLAVVGFAAFSASKIPLKLLFDVLAKRVRISEGRVNVREEDKKGNDETYYFFDMKERSFVVHRKAVLAIDPGGFYRVYYLPRSQTLVGIEPGVFAREAEQKQQQAVEVKVPAAGSI